MNQEKGNRTQALRWLAAGGVAYLGWQALQQLREESLEGQVVLITGGSRGLGLLLAREFAGEGCRLVICARDVQELEAARRDLEGRGAEVLSVQCDVAERAQVEQLIADATAHFGRIDVLVNNAGIIQAGPLETMQVEDFERAMAVMFWGSLYASLAVLPQMRERQSGRMVNITSFAAKVAVPHLLPYDCAKFAHLALSQGLRAELAKEGITVTTIVPGLMRVGSPVNAFFKGNAEREWDWFSVGAATPLTAMSAGRAARRIVQATKRGEAEVILTWQAKLATLVHDLFPGTTADILGVVNRILPDADPSQTEEVRGMELATPVSPSLVTTLMNQAAKETHQYEGEPEPSPEHAEQVGLTSRTAETLRHPEGASGD